MICPRCRVEINHHWDKIMYNVDTRDAGKTEPGLGGIIEEFHICPKCGGAASRHALTPSNSAINSFYNISFLVESRSRRALVAAPR